MKYERGRCKQSAKIGEFETENESAAIKVQPVSERPGGQQLGTKPARKVYPLARQQME